MATLRKRNGKWHVQIRRKNYASQTQTFTSKKIAERWIRETENKLDQGYLLQPSVNNSVTLKQLINRYIREILIKKRVCFNETTMLKAFMREKFVNKLILQITPEHFAKYRDKRLLKVKPATLLREFCVVQHLYNIANKEWGFNIPNPIKSIQKPTLNNRRERRLTNEEFTFLVKGNYPQVKLRNIIEVALETAMRRSEILNIKQEHIKGQTLLIPVTKNGHPRTIPLTKRALHILENT